MTPCVCGETHALGRSYYTSVQRDGPGGVESRALTGPYATHEAALAALPAARQRAYDADPQSAWYRFGTCSSDAPNLSPIFGANE